jgi:hypothetical protein
VNARLGLKRALVVVALAAEIAVPLFLLSDLTECCGVQEQAFNLWISWAVGIGVAAVLLWLAGSWIANGFQN